jgi:hypothetical protein
MRDFEDRTQSAGPVPVEPAPRDLNPALRL